MPECRHPDPTSFLGSPIWTNGIQACGDCLEEAVRVVLDAAVLRESRGVVPLVGALQTVLPLLTRFRGHAGFFGLVARFGFGLVFVTLALIPLLGAPGARPVLGSAVYAALFGGGLMMAAGMFGVTRSNFVLVFAAQAGVLAAVVFGLRALVEAAQRAL